MSDSYGSRRLWKNERYIRSEHLLSGGKFVSVMWTIKDIVYDLPAKKMGAKAGEDATTKMPGIEFEEAPGMVLGLCRTNESLASIATGEGHPAKWRGKKIQLVVRIIADRKTKTDIPCIRIWPSAAVKLGRLLEQMGRKIEDDFYANMTPAEPTQPPAQKANAKEIEELRQKMVIESEVMALGTAMGAVSDSAGMDACRATFSKLSSKLTAEQRTALVALADAAKARIAAVPVATSAAVPPKSGELV